MKSVAEIPCNENKAALHLDSTSVSSRDTLFLRMTELDIGKNIRQLRQQAGESLTTLAGRADLTKGTLSKIETGRVSSPISTLMRVADALGVPLARFFAEPSSGPPYALTRKGKGQVITRDGTAFGYSYEGLALALRDKLAEPFLLTIQPGEPIGHFQHGGEEFIYVLSGRIEFSVGEDVLTMGPGDSLYFDPTAEHRTRVLGSRPVRFLCLFIQDHTAATRKDSAA